MDNYWTFKVFMDAGTNIIEDWLSKLPPDIRAKIRTLLVHMANERNWVRPYFDKLKGYENLYEIIIKSNIQYRILGCHGPNRREFTLLIGATKGGASKRKSATWNPKNAREIANRRSKLIFEDRSYTDEYY